MKRDQWRRGAAILSLIPLVVALVVRCSSHGDLAGGTIVVGNPDNVSGVVVDSAGRPVTGVAVGLVSIHYDPLQDQPLGKLGSPSAIADSMKAITDDRGGFEFTNVAPDTYNIVGLSDYLKYRLFRRVVVLSAHNYPNGRLFLDTIRLREPGQVVLHPSIASPYLWVVVPGSEVAQRIDSAGVVTVTVPADTIPQILIVERQAGRSDSVVQSATAVVVPQAGIVDLTGLADTVSTPTVVTADSLLIPTTAGRFTAANAVSNKGFALQYRFAWGDSSISPWSADSVQSHQWSAAGSYLVQVQARLGTDTSVVSVWSPTKLVTVANTATADFTYVNTGTSIGITKYIGSDTNAVIPSTIDGLPVTSIGDSSFFGDSGLTSISIPSSVTSIGAWAFYYCTGLTSLAIPSGVTSIGAGAFSWCSGLSSAVIPSGVASIAHDAFFYCLSLASITIPSGVASIGDDAFGCCTVLTSITIPPGVTSIGDGAFGGCRKLTSIAIPSTVTFIGPRAFDYCSGLVSITIPDGVPSIGDAAFIDCISLTSITIPSSVTSIGSMAFAGCTYLTGITIPSGVTSIGTQAFFSAGLTSIAIPSGVTSISDGTFAYCDRLTSATISSTVTSIGVKAFYGTKIASITVPSAVTSIGDTAFGNCSALWNITVQAAVPPILGGSNVFPTSLIANAVIRVPSASLSSYQAAQLWSAYASYMRGY
jgi:hypothetical protein